MNRWRGPVWELLGLVRPVAGRLVVAALAGAAASISGIALMATSAWLISRAAQQPPVLSLTVAIVAVRGFAIAKGVLRYGERLAGHDAALRVLGRLRELCFAGLERIAPHRLPSGDAVSRFSSDVDTGLDVLVRVVLPCAAAAMAGAASVLLLAALQPGVAVVVALGLVAVCVGIPFVQRALANRADRQLAPLHGELASGTVELLHGLPEFSAYGGVERRIEALADVDQRLRSATRRSSRSVGIGAGLVIVIAGACVWAAVWLGASAVRSGQLNGVNLAVLVLTPIAVFDVVAGLPAASAQLTAAQAALRRVFAVVHSPAPVAVAARPQQLPRAPYTLAVNGVAARWDPDGPDVLHDLSVELRPGRRVAVVGPSGSGKSTLAALLVRFLDPVAGTVTINGTDVRRLDPVVLRRVVGLMSDDAWCFDTTVAANLRIGRPDSTDDDLRAALAWVGLLDWINTLPNGLATRVGERGSQLSGGQRRRLALARILLADPPILVLDEPTEHLDEESAAALTNDVLAAVGDRSVLLITHRPYGLDQVDEVIRLSSRR